jgi:hypothetical protein
MKRLILVAGAIYIASISVPAELTVGQVYRVNLVDVDGNSFSTADSHITTLVMTTQSGVDKARVVGDRIPNFCLGNPTYRMITVVVFGKNHSKLTRMLLSSLIRRRLDSEGHRLQDRYDKLKISRNARLDVSAVADFDGAITTQLGSQPAAGLFHVFVFGRSGELVKQWDEAPTVDELTVALKQN